MGIFKKIKTASNNTTTFRVGLLQTKAYRILKQHTARVLAEFDISTVDWAFLGLLYDAPKGMRSSVLAYELGVEAPFITQMVGELKKTNFIEHEPDPEDSRAKLLKLTPEGRAFVDKTERYLRDATKSLLKDIPLSDIVIYLSVLQSIIDNSY